MARMKKALYKPEAGHFCIYIYIYIYIDIYTDIHRATAFGVCPGSLSARGVVGRLAARPRLGRDSQLGWGGEGLCHTLRL